MERGFAHTLETGGMRRVHLRGRDNILKRYLVHVAGFNLSLVMREVLGFGTPRGLAGRLAALPARMCELFAGIWSALVLAGRSIGRPVPHLAPTPRSRLAIAAGASSTGC